MMTFFIYTLVDILYKKNRLIMNTKNINDKITLYPILNGVKEVLAFKNISKRTAISYMDGITHFPDFT